MSARGVNERSGACTKVRVGARAAEVRAGVRAGGGPTLPGEGSGGLVGGGVAAWWAGVSTRVCGGACSETSEGPEG